MAHRSGVDDAQRLCLRLVHVSVLQELADEDLLLREGAVEPGAERPAAVRTRVTKVLLHTQTHTDTPSVSTSYYMLLFIIIY